MKLYSYRPSSAAHRARIALYLKGIDFEIINIDLGRDEHRSETYKAVNPQMRVPALQLDDGAVLYQSPAIIEYLEETWPQPALLPENKKQRALARAVTAIIACDIHPLNNSSALKYLRERLKKDENTVDQWYANWINAGFSAIEKMITPQPYAFGASPGLADVYLVPQFYKAVGAKLPLNAYPKISSAVAACNKIEAFMRAHPDAEV